jgi:FKBP-type peptidyl-prolyl cis-trans isomerase
MPRVRSLLLGSWLLVVAVASAAACSRHVDEPSSDFKPAQGTPPPPAPTKLEIADTAPGSGREAKTGDTVRVQYTGTLLTGTKFDSSHDRHDEPFKFTLGQGQVIKGWDEGVVGMKVGGKRRLRIPSELAYGKSGHPPTIPADAALVFDIELVSIE